MLERAGEKAVAGPAVRHHEGGAAGLTIGSLCRQLRGEFPDISISKIRYLEDRKLLSPHRTPGGYRLYSPGDISRLKTILRAQRDRFLPLSVIRRELASGRMKVEEATDGSQGSDVGSVSGVCRHTFEELARLTGADAKLLRELEEYGIVKAKDGQGARHYDEEDREIVSAAVDLARYGVAGRNLRVFRSSAEKGAALLEQILAPSLHSSNARRRNEAHETLETLAAAALRLQHLILLRNLREVSR